MNTARKLVYCILALPLFLLLTACQDKIETTRFSSEGVTLEVPVDWKFNGLEKDGLYAPKEFIWDIGEFSSFSIYVYDKRTMEHFDEVTLEWFYHRFTRRSIPEFSNDEKVSETKNAISINGMNGIHAVIKTEFFVTEPATIKVFQKEMPNVRVIILFDMMSDDDPNISHLIEPILTSLSITD